MARRKGPEGGLSGAYPVWGGGVSAGQLLGAGAGAGALVGIAEAGSGLGQSIKKVGNAVASSGGGSLIMLGALLVGGLFIGGFLVLKSIFGNR